MLAIVSVICYCNRNVCRFILFSTQSRKPINKCDVAEIFKRANIKMTRDVMILVAQKLEHGWGLCLCEAPNKRQLFLAIKQEDDPQRKAINARMLNLHEDDKAWRGLVSVTLQLLILFGQRCETNAFENYLFTRLDTRQFGTQKQIMAQLKQQKWISIDIEPDSERQFYILGPRANIETSTELQYTAAQQLVNGSGKK